jgi:hypothetical protein
MASAKVSPASTLVFINIGIAFGMVLGYLNRSVDKFSLLAIGRLSLLVFNGMFFLLRRTETDLPGQRRKKLQNGWSGQSCCSRDWLFCWSCSAEDIEWSATGRCPTLVALSCR